MYLYQQFIYIIIHCSPIYGSLLIKPVSLSVAYYCYQLLVILYYVLSISIMCYLLALSISIVSFVVHNHGHLDVFIIIIIRCIWGSLLLLSLYQMCLGSCIIIICASFIVIRCIYHHYHCYYYYYMIVCSIIASISMLYHCNLKPQRGSQQSRPTAQKFTQ